MICGNTDPINSHLHSLLVSLCVPTLAVASQRTARALSSLTLIIIYASAVRWDCTRLFSLSCDLLCSGICVK